jgi:uncharacterized protein (TIGR02246 family)
MSKPNFRRRLASLTLLVGIGVLATTASAKECLLESDRDAIRGVHEAYRIAWLANDGEAVRLNFTEDAVLLPHHGLAPVEGMAAIKQFWWRADAKLPTITRFEASYDEIGGCGTIGFVRGRSHVEWSVVENGKLEKFSNSGTFLTLMRKLPNGAWKITHQMWDDPPNLKQ